MDYITEFFVPLWPYIVDHLIIDLNQAGRFTKQHRILDFPVQTK
jgi:hypothetical protein